MTTVTRKYIITPTYAPLYAARKCWGPEHGPLNQPTLFPVDIIGLRTGGLFRCVGGLLIGSDRKFLICPRSGTDCVWGMVA